MKSLQLTRPNLLMVVGIPGSGKSHFAEKFAETFGAPYVATDKILPFVTSNDNASQVALYQIHELVKTRQTIVIDGATETRLERNEIARIARSAGYDTLLIWVQTDPATAKSRALKSSVSAGNVQLTSDAYDQLFRRFTAPNATEKSVVVSGKHTYATQAKVVLKKLSESRAEVRIEARATPPARKSEPARRNIIIH
jgi:predicted kinase